MGNEANAALEEDAEGLAVDEENVEELDTTEEAKQSEGSAPEPEQEESEEDRRQRIAMGIKKRYKRQAEEARAETESERQRVQDLKVQNELLQLQLAENNKPKPLKRPVYHEYHSDEDFEKATDEYEAQRDQRLIEKLKAEAPKAEQKKADPDEGYVDSYATSAIELNNPTLDADEQKVREVLGPNKFDALLRLAHRSRGQLPAAKLVTALARSPRDLEAIDDAADSGATAEELYGRLFNVSQKAQLPSKPKAPAPDEAQTGSASAALSPQKQIDALMAKVASGKAQPVEVIRLEKRLRAEGKL